MRRRRDLDHFSWQACVLVNWVQPTWDASERRQRVFQHVRSLLQQSPGLEDVSVLLTGSFPLKTYLPDADIDITLLLPPSSGLPGATGANDCLLQVTLRLDSK